MSNLREIIETIADWGDRNLIVNPFEMVALINLHIASSEHTASTTSSVCEGFGITPEALSNIISLLHRSSRLNLEEMGRTEAMVLSSKFVQLLIDGMVH